MGANSICKAGSMLYNSDMSRKIAIVVQRYGLEINGGAEYHARLIAEKLARHFMVEVFTTTAYDYITWDHFYEKQREILNGITVNRFQVDKPRDPQAFGRVQNLVFNEEHSPADELLWLEEEGPLVPGLIRELERREGEFAYFIFFSYRYYHSYWGVKRLAGKAILVPTAEHDQVVYLDLFKEFFSLPSAIVYNSPEEKELLNRVSGNSTVYGDVVGVGSEIPECFDAEGTCRALGIRGKYAVYIGRLDENKGVPELLRFYLRLLDEEKHVLDLLLIGKALIAVPEHPRIRYLGFRSDREKYDLLKGSEFLINTCFFHFPSRNYQKQSHKPTSVKDMAFGLWWYIGQVFRASNLPSGKNPGFRRCNKPSSYPTGTCQCQSN